jgi:hypothetical protein
MWNKEYKGIKIYCNEYGLFVANIQGKDYIKKSFSDMKETIDNNTKLYYTITEKDYQNLINKLSPRETHFVSNLIKEVNCHSDNAYCELSITDSFKFNINELNKLTYYE